jgi:hypothetical protein
MNQCEDCSNRLAELEKRIVALETQSKQPQGHPETVSLVAVATLLFKKKAPCRRSQTVRTMRSRSKKWSRIFC